MIPRAHITAWRARVPWPTDAQVEQDLILYRALVEMFNRPELVEGLLFRGGTALHKLFVSPSGRYSEDIDLVQVRAEPKTTNVGKTGQKNLVGYRDLAPQTDYRVYPTF